MNKPAFERHVKHILKWEGGYVNDPRDPGGETNLGISKRAYPQLDIKSLTVPAAQAIYKRDYWDKTRCDDLPSPLALLVFDAAVNQGVGAAIKMLQKAAGVTADGDFGPKTLAAIQAESTSVLVFTYANERLERYMANKNFNIYCKGWLRRLLSTLNDATQEIVNG